MEYIRLGKTDLVVSKTSFGTEGLQTAVRGALVSEKNAAFLLKKAYEGGINFFDIAPLLAENSFTPNVFSEIRSAVIFAFSFCVKKTLRERGASIVNGASGTNGTFGISVDITSALEQDVRHNLAMMQTDYADLYQIQDGGFVPYPDGKDGLYDALHTMHENGTVRHIGFSTDNYDRACEAASCGLYETVQFPFNFLITDECLLLAKLCQKYDTGFIASQPLAGGLIKNIPLAVGFMHCYENAVPVWGIQREEELDQLLYFAERSPVIDEQFLQDLDCERRRLRQ